MAAHLLHAPGLARDPGVRALGGRKPSGPYRVDGHGGPVVAHEPGDLRLGGDQQVLDVLGVLNLQPGADVGVGGEGLEDRGGGGQRIARLSSTAGPSSTTRSPAVAREAHWDAGPAGASASGSTPCRTKSMSISLVRPRASGRSARSVYERITARTSSGSSRQP